MKKFLPVLLLLFFCACSKESIRRQKENLVKDAMVSGQWKVTSFTNAGADITTSFHPYKFQFNENFTVDAINNGTVEKSGTWDADPDKRTITSTFLNAAEPLLLLNGTWLITNSTWTSVEATLSVNGEVRSLRLDKE